MYFKKTVTTYSRKLVHDDDKNWGMHVTGCHLSDKVLTASCILDCPMCLDDHCLCDLLPVWIILSGYLSTRLDCLPCPVLLFWCLPMSTPNPSPPHPHSVTQSLFCPLRDKIWQLGLELLYWDYSLPSQTMNHDSPKLPAQAFQWEGMLENAFSCQMRFCKWENVLWEKCEVLFLIVCLLEMEL